MGLDRQKTLAQSIMDKAIDGGYNIYALPTLAFLKEDTLVVDVSGFNFIDNEHIAYECMWKDSFGEMTEGDNCDNIRIIASQHDFAKAFFGKRWKRHLMEMILREDWVGYLICYL